MLVTHRGTKVDIGPTTQHPAVTVAIKSHGAQQRAKISATTASSACDTAIRDEDAFAKQYLASQSSIYFRKRKTYPRSFFWRVIEDSTCLELRAVDLTKSSQDHHESNVTIRLEFENAIVPHGVALADVEGHESLSVFVLLRSKQLYTFTMRPEYFRKLELIDENINDWCKTCSPAPLGFSFPHRLYAASPYELFISLDSGSLLSLTRKVGDDGMLPLRCPILSPLVLLNGSLIVYFIQDHIGSLSPLMKRAGAFLYADSSSGAATRQFNMMADPWTLTPPMRLQQPQIRRLSSWLG